MNHGKRVFGENCVNCEQAQGKLPWRCDLTHVKKTQTCELQRPRLCVITLRNYSAINREWGGPWAATIKDHLSKFRGERSCSVGGLTCFGAKIIWAGRFICLYTYKQNIFKRVLRRVGSSGTPLSDKLESAKKNKNRGGIEVWSPVAPCSTPQITGHLHRGGNRTACRAAQTVIYAICLLSTLIAFLSSTVKAPLSPTHPPRTAAAAAEATKQADLNATVRISVSFWPKNVINFTS